MGLCRLSANNVSRRGARSAGFAIAARGARHGEQLLNYSSRFTGTEVYISTSGRPIVQAEDWEHGERQESRLRKG